MSDTVSFGYEDVSPDEKTARVGGVFSNVAERYDVMNDAMSGGMHRVWKDAMITALNPPKKPGWRFIDVAGGTGDIAFRIEAACPEAEVLLLDLTPGMLEVGRDRALDRGRPEGRFLWVAGDAETLPLPDRSVDAYTIAFGLRNVTRPQRALAEARRVLKPGGRFLCLEFSQVVLPLLARLYDLYSFRVLPLMGQVVAQDRDSYQYLVESIRRFPPQEELLAMMAEAGLARGSYENLSGGIAAIHQAWRI